MANESNPAELQHKAAELRRTLATVRKTDTNGDRKLSGAEVADAAVEQWLVEHAHEKDPFKGISERLAIVRDGKAIDDAWNGRDKKTAEALGESRLAKAYAAVANARGDLYDMLEGAVGRLQQALRFNVTEVAVTHEQQRAAAEAKAGKAAAGAADAAEGRNSRNELNLPPEIANKPQVRALLEKIESGQVSPEERAAQIAMLREMAKPTNKAVTAQATKIGAEAAAGQMTAVDAQIAEARANAAKAAAGLPEPMREQYLKGMEATFTQMREAAGSNAAQLPGVVKKVLEGGAAEIRVVDPQEQATAAKGSKLTAEQQREVQGLREQLAAYKPENVATPTIDELSAAVAKYKTSHGQAR